MSYVDAVASPEKNLFISLLTRDIPLISALLDLVDNSINAAVEPFSKILKTAEDYAKVAVNPDIRPEVDVNITIAKSKVSIKDNASGINLETAQNHIFKFGRAADEVHENDRLSVYGIGLKRAIFKLGNKISIVSDHVQGGFELKLDVKKWALDKTIPWVFKITPRDPVAKEATGTTIVVNELYEETKRRIDDGQFVGELNDKLSKTYAFYLAHFANIFVNDVKVEGISIDMSENRNSESFDLNGVTCSIQAGIGTAIDNKFKGDRAGWFVICNGRTVVSADQSKLTGWGGGGTSLPIFQPKHRPFLGIVFLVSENAVKLPWDTTKSRINEDSAVWQRAKRQMASMGRSVIKFLDNRYTEDGTEVSPDEMSDVGKERIKPLQTATIGRISFKPPKTRLPTNVNIAYKAKIADVERIKRYLGASGMAASKVGKYTFQYFLDNEAGDE